MKFLRLANNMALIGMILLSTNQIFGQITIQQSPSLYQQFSTRDVFNVGIVNMQQSSIRGKLFAQVLNERGGLIAEVSSDPVVVQKGYNQFNEAIIGANGINYLSDEAHKFEMIYRNLPPGRYEVCVSFKYNTINVETSKNDLETRSCNNYQSQFRVPLVLNFPSANNTIEETQPTFGWTPTLNVMSDVRYTLKLVEIIDGQDANAALTTNAVILNIDNIESNVVSFPNTITPLVDGNSYAWQVFAFKDRQVLALSEPITFKVKRKENNISNNSYIKLQPNLTGSCINLNSEVLSVQFEERYSTGDFKCKIYDSKGKTIVVNMKNDPDTLVKRLGKTSNDFSPMMTKHGLNKYSINIKESNLQPGLYVLEAINIKEEKFYLKFKVI
jgi:hypothetical protein